MSDPTEHLLQHGRSWLERWEACLAALQQPGEGTHAGEAADPPALGEAAVVGQPHAHTDTDADAQATDPDEEAAQSPGNASIASSAGNAATEGERRHAWRRHVTAVLLGLRSSEAYRRLLRLLTTRLEKQPFLLSGLVPPLFKDMLPAVCAALREEPWQLQLLPAEVGVAHPAMVAAAVASHGPLLFHLRPAARAVCDATLLRATVLAHPDHFMRLSQAERTRELCAALVQRYPRMAATVCTADSALPLQAAVEVECVTTWEAAIASYSPSLLSQVPATVQAAQVEALATTLLQGKRDAVAAMIPVIAAAAWHQPLAREASSSTAALLRSLFAPLETAAEATPPLPWLAAFPGATPVLPTAIALARQLDASERQGPAPQRQGAAGGHGVLDQRMWDTYVTLRQALVPAQALQAIPVTAMGRPLQRLLLLLWPEQAAATHTVEWNQWSPLLRVARAAGFAFLLVPHLPPVEPHILLEGAATAAAAAIADTAPAPCPAVPSNPVNPPSNGVAKDGSETPQRLLKWRDLLCLPPTQLLAQRTLTAMAHAVAGSAGGPAASAGWRLFVHLVCAGLGPGELHALCAEPRPERMASIQSARTRRALDPAALRAVVHAWEREVEGEARTALEHWAIHLRARAREAQCEAKAWIASPLQQRIQWLQDRVEALLSLHVQDPTQGLVLRRMLGVLPPPPPRRQADSPCPPPLPRTSDNVAYVREQKRIAAAEVERLREARRRRTARYWWAALTCGLGLCIGGCIGACCSDRSDACGYCGCNGGIGPASLDCTGCAECCSLLG